MANSNFQLSIDEIFYLRRILHNLIFQQIIKVKCIEFYYHIQMSGEIEKYHLCKKGQLHQNQVLNLICLEDECISNSLMCVMCLHENHNDHKFRHLKNVIKNAEQIASNFTETKLNKDNLFQIIQDSQKRALDNFQSIRKKTVQCLDKVKLSIDSLYLKILGQIQFKVSKEKLGQIIDNLKSKEANYEFFLASLQKLLAGVSFNIQDNIKLPQLNDQNIEKAVKLTELRLKTQAAKKEENIEKQLQKLQIMIKQVIKRPFEIDYINLKLNIPVAIYARNNKKYLDGGSYDGSVAVLVEGKPKINKRLQWTIKKLGQIFIIQHNQSTGYLDGRAYNNQECLVTQRDPTNDTYLQWKIIQTGDEDWFVFQSVSSNCYLDGRNFESEALVTDRPWKNDFVFYFKIIDLSLTK